jgi:large conductance mechanosensitive channel
MAGLARTALNEARQDLGGFKKFIVRGSVVDLAIGVVIGAAFGNVVQALVKGVIEPLITAFGGPNAAGLAITIGQATFQFGDLLIATISFFLIALVVYFVIVLPTNKLVDQDLPKPAPTKECPECTSKIPKAARRCPECTAQLLPPSKEVAGALRQVAGSPRADVAHQHAPRVLADDSRGRMQGRSHRTKVGK